MNLEERGSLSRSNSRRAQVLGSVRDNLAWPTLLRVTDPRSGRIDTLSISSLKN